MKSSGFLVRIRAHLLQLSRVGDPREAKMSCQAGNSSSSVGAGQQTQESDMGGLGHKPGFNLGLQQYKHYGPTLIRGKNNMTLSQLSFLLRTDWKGNPSQAMKSTVYTVSLKSHLYDRR